VVLFFFAFVAAIEPARILTRPSRSEPRPAPPPAPKTSLNTALRPP
jgi:hypothetical protein